MGKKILLGTSIALFELEKQKSAIKTWIDFGARVISCNCQEEILLLQKEFPEVDFIEVERTGLETFNKPFVFVYDIISQLSQNAGDDEVIGIINSDILLYNLSDELIEYIKIKTENSLVIVHRQNIQKIETRSSSRCIIGGVDIMFFNKKLMNVIEDEGFLLGQTPWDHWLPIISECAGIKVLDLKNIIAYHVEHPIRWSYEVGNQYGAKIARKYLQVENQPEIAFTKKIHSIFARLDNGICYTNSKIKNQKVLIILKDKNEQVIGDFEAQTYRNFRIFIGEYEEAKKQGIKEKYVVFASNKLRYMNTFLEMMVQDITSGAHDIVQGTISATYEDKDFGYGLVWNGDVNKAIIAEISEEVSVSSSIFTYQSIKNKSYKEIVIKNSKCKYLEVPLATIDMSILLKQYFSGRIGQKVYIMPAGKVAMQLAESIKKMNCKIEILGFLDNNKDLHGKKIESIEIFDPDIIISNQKSFDKIIIASPLYGVEIHKQLLGYVKSEKLFISDGGIGIDEKLLIRE